MRLPASKVYRAFPELDRFSDPRCTGFVQSAQKAHGPARALVGLVVVLGMIPGGCVGGGFAIAAAQATMGDIGTGDWRTLAAVAMLTGGVAVPAVGGLLVRDIWLRRIVREQIDRCICPKCRYSLLGLPPCRSAVICPECGTRHALASLGVSEQDLLVLASEADGGTGGPRIQSMMERR